MERLRRFSMKKPDPNTNQIFKKFLDFISSSMWDIPVATFIEQKSIVFDPDQGDPTLHESIHKEYSELIDTLIECFCDDAGIKSQQLVEALQAIEREKLNAKMRAALEPVAAAQDFNTFVPMMMRKNVELQLQALQMIEFMCGLLPTVLRLDEWEDLRGKTELTPEETERYIMIAVMRKSKEEYDLLNQKQLALDLDAIQRCSEEERRRLEAKFLRDKEMDRLQRQLQSQIAIANESSKNSENKPSAPPLPEPTTPSAPPQEPQPEQTAKPKTPEPRPPSTRRKSSVGERKSREIEEIKQKKPPTAVGLRRNSTSKTRETKEQKEEKKGRTAADVNALLQEPSRIASADLRARAEYLKSQRDKLLEMKRAEREKQFHAESASSGRPKTAQTAGRMLRGEKSERNSSDHTDVINARKALVEKLKTEMTTEG